MQSPALSLAVCTLLAIAAPLAVQGQTQTTLVPQSKSEISLSFSPVVKAAGPAVVNIYARRMVESRNPFGNDPFFGRLFRDFGGGRPEVQNSLGSGVIVDGDGLVVSNAHVVDGATEIIVVLADKREYRAEVALSDRDNDLAVLRLQDAYDLPVLPIRDSNSVEVGDLVLAIGNPFGLGQTVSLGIISALARSLPSVGDGRGYFLQTDAAINPGNSGGALVDGEGRLVGINTAIFTQSGGSNGVGFAIPSNLVSAVIAQARGGAEAFVRPWAGVTAQVVDGALAAGLGLDRPMGVILSELHPQSPFTQAGLRAGDVVVALDGAPVNSPAEMLFRMSARGIGAEVAVSYLREGSRAEARVALGTAPDMPPREARVISGGGVLAGMEVARVNPAVIAELDLPMQAKGVAVLRAEGWSAQAGLRRGDVLLSINGAEIRQPRDVEAAAQSGGRGWSIDLLRRGQPMRLRFRT